MKGKNTDLWRGESIMKEIEKAKVVDEKEKEIEKKKEVETTQIAEESMLEKTSVSLKDLSISQVLAIVIEAKEKLDQILNLFNEKISKDKTKNRLFERLHEELSRYKEDFIYEKILKRIFLDLIHLLDRVEGIIEHSKSSDGVSKNMLNNLTTFREEIIQTLKRQGVIMIQKGRGKFDEEYQEAMDIEITNNPEENLIVTRIVKRGFKYGKRLLRPEIVIVKKYKEPNKRR